MACSRTLLLLLLLARPSLAKAPLRYLALGDSFTAGTGTTPERSFPAQLAALWRGGGRDVELANLGVNGYTTQDLLDEELPPARAFRPDLVTLAIGANDLVHGAGDEDYRAQLRRIFGALAAVVEAPRIVVLAQPDWSRSPAARAFGSPTEIGAHIRRFNDIRREETARAGARWVDLSSLLAREAEAHMVAADGLHPSAAAYREWALAIAAQVTAPASPSQRGANSIAPPARPQDSPPQGVPNGSAPPARPQDSPPQGVPNGSAPPARPQDSR